MRRSDRAGFGFFMLVMIVSGSASAACRPDGDSLMCGIATQSVRVLKDTTSPDKAYAIGWRMQGRGGIVLGADAYKTNLARVPDVPTAPDGLPAPKEGEYIYPNVRDVIVSLSDGRVLREVSGFAWETPDGAISDHNVLTPLWSKDSRFLLDIADGRAWTNNVVLYRLDKGTVSDVVDLTSEVFDAAIAEARRLSKIPVDGGTPRILVFLRDDATFEPDGALKILVAFDTDPSVNYELALKPVPAGGHFAMHIESVKARPAN